MAEAKHYKLSRKDLREPDEFQALTTQTVDWLRANQSAVVGALSTIVAVAAVVVGVGWYSQRQANAAAVQFESAQTMFGQKKFADAASEFAAVASAYPRTPSGRLASLYRAHALAEQSDPGAAAAYGEYLAAAPPTDYLRQQALVDMARAQEAAKDTAAATDTYRKAAEIDGPFRTPAQPPLARLEEAAGAKDKALALYAEVAKAPELDPETRQAITARLPPATAPANPTPPAE